MADLLRLNDYVQQGFQQGRERHEKATLAKLYSQALAAPEDQQAGMVQQMAAVNPDFANSAQTNFSNGRKQAYDDLGREAGMFVALAQSGDPATAQAAYTRLAQKAQAAGHPVPPTYDPKMLPMIEKLASVSSGQSSELQTFNAMTQGMGVDDIARARRIQLGLDPRAVTGATKFDTFTGADGRPRPQRNNPTTGGVEIYYDESGQWVPLGQGSQPQAAPQQRTGMTQVQYATSDGQPIPQNEQAAAQAAFAADARGQDFNITVPPSGGGSGAPSVPGLGVGRRAEDEAAAVEAAKQRAQLDAMPERNALEAQGAGQTTAAQRTATAEVDKKYGIGTALDANAAVAERHAKLNQALDAVDGIKQSADDIHALTQMPGYKALGTASGDMLIKAPLVRNGVKDANAALDGIRSKTIVEALAKMKALSANGASGWGSLTEKEEEIIANSIAVLRRKDQSHEAIDQSLAKISRTLQNAANRLGSNIRQFRGADGQQQAAPRTLKFNPATGKIE